MSDDLDEAVLLFTLFSAMVDLELSKLAGDPDEDMPGVHGEAQGSV